jgi:hypothetical protein
VGQAVHEARVPALAVLEAGLVEVHADALASYIDCHLRELLVKAARQLAVGPRAVGDEDVRHLVHHVLELAEVRGEQTHVVVGGQAELQQLDRPLLRPRG